LNDQPKSKGRRRTDILGILHRHVRNLAEELEAKVNTLEKLDRRITSADGATPIIGRLDGVLVEADDLIVGSGVVELVV